MRNTLRGRSGRSLVAVLMVGALLAACGSDDDSKGTATDSTDQPAAGTNSQTTDAGSDATTGSDETTPATDSETTGPTGELKVAASMADLATLDPPRAFADINGLLQPLYGEPLVVVDQSDPTTIMPGLAESWEVSDDGLTYTFKLRADAIFSTGKTMTADDVVFSFNRLKNLQGSVAFVLDGMTNIEATDPTTVVVTLSAPDSSFLAKITNGALMILDSTALADNGGVADETAVDADKAQEFLDANTVGTGPYKLTEWKRNERVVFEANPEYTGSNPPAFQKITVQDVVEPATQRQLLEGGSVDLAVNIDADTAAGLVGTPDVTVDVVPSVNLIYLALNGNEGFPFANPLVRQAVQKAIDYDGISILTGGAKRPAAVIPLGLQGIDQVDPIATDVEGALALMDQAGLSDGLSMDVTYANYAPYGVPLTTLWEKLSVDLAKINITLNLKPVEYDAWLETFRAGELPLTSSIWAPDFLDVTNYLDFFASPEGPVAKRVGMNIPELGTLFDQIKASNDTAERETLSAQSATIMRDDASLIPVVQPNSVIVYRSSVTGVTYSPNHQVELLAIKPA